MANTKVIVIPEGKICDYVDGKFRNDTPEEYVRQTIEKRLVNEHKLSSYFICSAAVLLMAIFRQMSQQTKCTNMLTKFCVHHLEN